MTETDFLDKLEGVQQKGKNWTARCPAHEDNRNSLSVSTGDDGKLLIFCHAGCNVADVAKAVGVKLADLFPPQPTVALGSTKKSKSKVVAEYDYRDADGTVVYQAVRMEPKNFRQRRPDGNGGWLWNMQGVDRVPYRLPELMASDATVYVVEGEKDVDRLAGLGIVATCNVGGAGKWNKSYSQYFQGRDVVVLPDNDDAGRDHAEAVAGMLSGTAGSIKVVALPDLPAKADVSDWLEAGGTADTLTEMADAATEWKPDPSKPPKAKKEKCPSQATVLVGIVDGDVDLFHSPNGDAYATVSVDGHGENYLIRSKAFRRWMARQFYVATGGIPNSQATQDAINVLEGQALFEGAEHDVHVRVAEHGGTVYLDMCNAGWQAVEIDAKGWRVVNNVPVKFRRAKAMLPLPEPAEGIAASGRARPCPR